MERLRRSGGGRGLPARRAPSTRIFPLDATQDLVFTLEDLARLPDTPLAGVVRDAVRFYVASIGRRTASTAATFTTR